MLLSNNECVTRFTLIARGQQQQQTLTLLRLLERSDGLAALVLRQQVLPQEVVRLQRRVHGHREQP
jgi:hypothetical protein